MNLIVEKLYVCPIVRQSLYVSEGRSIYEWRFPSELTNTTKCEKLFITVGCRVKLFMSAGCRVKLFMSAGSRVKLFLSAGWRVKLFVSAGCRVKLFMSVGCRVKLFMSAGCRVKLFMSVRPRKLDYSKAPKKYTINVLKSSKMFLLQPPSPPWGTRDTIVNKKSLVQRNQHTINSTNLDIAGFINRCFAVFYIVSK